MKLAWAKINTQRTLGRWFSVTFDSNRRVFVRHRVGEQMISACVVPTVKHGEGGLLVTQSDLFRIEGTAFCSNTPSHLVCA
jgi:hypothetical protein